MVISFYAPKQTVFFALFVVRAVENDRLFLLSVKVGDFLAKVVGLEEKVDSFSQAAVERDCVGRVVPLARVTRAQRVFVFLPSPLHLSLTIG